MKFYTLEEKEPSIGQYALLQTKDKPILAVCVGKRRFASIGAEFKEEDIKWAPVSIMGEFQSQGSRGDLTFNPKTVLDEEGNKVIL